MNGDEFPYPLVTTDWLTARISVPTVKVIDGSWRMPGGAPARLDHEKRRIPGAVFFDIDSIADKSTALPHMLPTAAEFSAAVGALGIGSGDDVIVYDDQGVFSAARVWWTFRAMGHERVSVLDGGLPKWRREGRRIETGPAAPARADYKARPNPSIVRTADAVRLFLKGGRGVVLDARPAQRFKGAAAEPRPGLRSGRMPGAVNLPHALLISESGELRPLNELAKLFHDRDVHAETDVIATCGSGVTAALIALALERLGHRRHALYDGSWAEWGRQSNDPALYPAIAD
jgi:thiosulfate/3-mercaptopyruvate sulfurtransferase